MDSSNDSGNQRRHLGRQVIAVCITFAVLVFLASTVASYFSVRGAVMERYKSELGDVLRVTAAQIDVEDLEECMQTKTESAKLRELASHMDIIRQNASFDYLVIVQPVKDGDDYDVLAVVSGLLPEERAGENLRDDMVIPQLGDSTGAAYDPDFIPVIYDDMLNRHDIKFSSSDTAYGQTYDAAISIRNAQGEGIALLTAGIASNTIDAAMMRYLIIIAIVMLVLSVAFLLVMNVWLRKQVIEPIRRIERAAKEFERKSGEVGGSQALVLDLSDIRTGNELESLAGSLESMSREMRDYVERLMSSSVKIAGMEREIARVSELALRDDLTGVGNKTCFSNDCELLDKDIADGTAKFALLMADLNELKKINDTYGHDKGDEYIQAGCGALCRVFAHSPVYRIGGDEFVVLLKDGDLAARDELLGQMDDIMRASSQRDEKWKRVSVALGLATFDPSVDASASDVLMRADKAMYANKRDARS